MRPFCLTVAFLTFVGGVGCVAIVSNLERVYEELGAPLSSLAKLFVVTSGWIPGGILVTLAVLVAIFVAVGKDKASLSAIPKDGNGGVRSGLKITDTKSQRAFNLKPADSQNGFGRPIEAPGLKNRPRLKLAATESLCRPPASAMAGSA